MGISLLYIQAIDVISPQAVVGSARRVSEMSVGR